ncbi:tail protein [Gordonia phage Samman98]|uniref:Hydrolase n=1 Tax=Gordonia phage Samman98 TaxID=2862998 RepID=A0AC61N9E7_9CAUD|nr:tail protein [Gordonia phage Samman98]QYC54509.1 hydrolase [Gordonia phage Samman98]
MTPRITRLNPPVGRSEVATDYMGFAAADARYELSGLSPLYGYFAKLAQARTSRVDILMVGDSIMEGQGADVVPNRWVDRAQRRLRSMFCDGPGGRGYLPATYAATAGTTGVAFPSAWTYTGPAGVTHLGPGFKSRHLNGVGATATLNLTTMAWTSVRLLFRRHAADVVTIAIDGGAPTTFTMNTGKHQQYWDSPIMPSGPHTLVITVTAGQPSFCGGHFYDGDETAGLSLWDGSHSGARMWHYTASGDSQAEWVKHLSDGINASLIVLGCATNDSRSSSNGYSSANYKTHTETIISAVRARIPNVPILAMPPYQPLAATIEPWASYMGKLAEIAAATPYVAVFDMSKKIPNLTGDPYGFLVDGVHASALGQGMQAELGVSALSI